MKRTEASLLGIAAALTAAVAFWAHGTMAAGRDAARRAAEDSAECRRMADRIESLRQRPSLAQQHERASAETTGLIEASAKAAGITTAKLVRISPESPQRLGDTVYMAKPTRVLLKSVTLQQVVSLVHRIVTDPNGLHARSMRITAPSADDTGELWTAELVFTYLIYEPPKIARIAP